MPVSWTATGGVHVEWVVVTEWVIIAVGMIVAAWDVISAVVTAWEVITVGEIRAAEIWIRGREPIVQGMGPMRRFH